MSQFKHFSIIQYFVLVVFFLYSIHFDKVLSVKTTHNERKSENVKFDYNEASEERLRAHYALDYTKAVSLAFQEQKLAEQFVEFLPDFQVYEYVYVRRGKKSTSQQEHGQDACHEQLERYLEEFDMDASAVKSSDKSLGLNRIPDNPILLYRMIRRIFVTLPNVKKVCSDYVDIVEAIGKTFTTAIPPPTLDDLKDALLGILRIHYVYGFSAHNELRVGKFGDIQTHARLNFHDCLALGDHATEQGGLILAYQWYLAANLTFTENPQSVGSTNASEALDASWKNLLEYSPYTKMDRLHRVMSKARQDTWSPLFHKFSDYAMCRGETGKWKVNESTLVCFLDCEEHPYFYINPLKVEVLLSNPPVYQFHEFIGEHTMEYIKRISASLLARSGVVSNDQRKTIYTNYRTSLTTWLYDDFSFDPAPELVALNRRIEFLTNFHVLKPGSSHALQVASYTSLGGHYDFHDDALENEILTKQHGDRIATFFMFFTDVPLGGHTAFPKLNIYAKPIKGSAIIWFSLYKNGAADRRTSHGGCPVVLGRKLGANKWILQYENMFRYQCSLNPKR